MYFLGAALMISGVLFASFIRGIPLLLFLNIPVILIILSTIIGVIVATSGFRTFTRGFAAAVSAKYVIDDTEREKAVSLFRLLNKAVILASFIPMFMGFIAMCAHMDDPELMAHALAVALLGPLTCMVISVAIFMPAVYNLRKVR